MSTRTKRRACEGKRRHETKRKADDARWSLIRAGLAYVGQMIIYRCGHCGSWHLGHRAKKGRRR